MKRNENETFEAYKLRRKKQKRQIKRKLTPRFIWKSKYIPKSFEDWGESKDPNLNQGTKIGSLT